MGHDLIHSFIHSFIKYALKTHSAYYLPFIALERMK